LSSGPDHASFPFSTMNDARFDALSSVLTRHSTALKPGEKVLIDAFDIPDEFV